MPPADAAPARVDVPTRHVATLLAVLGRLDRVLTAALAGRSAPQPVTPIEPGGLLDLREHPAGSRFRRLAEEFELSPVEIDLLLLAAAPQLDRRYGELVACLEQDLNRLRPTVAMAVDLLGLTPAQRLVTRTVLTPGSRLIGSGLVRLEEPPGAKGCPLLHRELSVDDRVADFLIGSDVPDAVLDGLADVVDLSPRPPDSGPLVLPAQVARRVDALRTAPPRLCVLRGPAGSGREAVAQLLARAWGLPALLRVRTDRLCLDDPDRFAGQLLAVAREARLRGAATFWEGFDALRDEGRDARRESVLAELGRHRHAFLSVSDDRPVPVGAAAVEVALPALDTSRRAQVWRRGLSAAGVRGAPQEDVAALAGAFRLGPGAIAAAIAEAVAGGPVGPAELAAAARRQGSAALAREAERVEQPFAWEDLVLPPDRVQRLRAIGHRIRHRAQVHDGWGFGATLASSRGTAALFTGPSGTGKTMAAGVLARSLGLDLYRVDLAAVVSKYIGETEKNLARVFAAAEATDAVLFFDEADALFGKRTEVHDAHDRYANVEVAYLLQRIEGHDGLVVLATNLRKNVDEAFLRRLAFVVEFPLPDLEHRRLIWRRMFPAAAPLDPALDLDLLADRFELSGGSIRNVAVEAAFAAAADGTSIGPNHVELALRHEHQKLGRVAPDLSLAGRSASAPLMRSAG
jgi:hypothetical protein